MVGFVNERVASLSAHAARVTRQWYVILDLNCEHLRETKIAEVFVCRCVSVFVC